MRGATAAATLLVAVLAVPPTAPADPPAGVVLELAPGELGELRTGGMVVMAAAPGGKELLLLDAGTGEVHEFLESGSRWGEPLRLTDERGAPFALQSPAALAVGSGMLAVAGTFRSYLFDLDDGAAEAHTSRLPFAVDVESTPSGWAVGLVSMPLPPPAARAFGGGRLAGDRVPRVVLLDDELETWREGLLDEELPESGSIATGRRLKLAWDGRRLYAAELANYRIFALDRKLALRATYRDPELFLERGVDRLTAEATRAAEDRMRAAADRQGRRLVPPPEEGEEERPRPAAEAFTYEPVIHDIAWDHRLDRLLLLLAAGVVGGSPALDILDPESGDVRRLELRFPAGAEPQSLSQIVAGHRYLWLRSHADDSRTWRLHRTALEHAGRLLRVPEVGRVETVAGE